MINPLLKELSNNNRIPPFDIIKNSQFKEAVIFSINKQSSTIEKFVQQEINQHLEIQLFLF